MRRRRQRNPLLMRIIVISILAHIVALPILAHFGAFKKIQEKYAEIVAVKLAPPPDEKKPETAKKAEKAKPQHVAAKARRGPTNASHARQVAHATTNTPHIATAVGGTGGGGGFEAPEGTGKAGEIPTEAKPKGPATPTAPTAPPPVTTAPTAPPKAVEAPREIARVDKPAAPITKLATPAPMPKQPVFTEAEPALPLEQEPQPTIPDDLRAEALDKTCVVVCTVSPDGKATDVKVSQSSGNSELDNLALDAARKWKFKPGTRDGEPIESTVNLHIEFQVS
jgi:protein TonB